MERFDRIAASERDQGLLREFLYLLGRTKKWWLLPILIVVFGFGVLVWLSGTAAAPFIYTLF